MDTLKPATNIKIDFIKAMRHLLKTEGLKGLDVRKIVKVTGCSIGTFYNHYKSLDDLIIYFNGETLDILKGRIFDKIDLKDTPKDIIRKLCHNYITFAEKNHTEWLLLVEHPIKIRLPEWYQDKIDQLFQQVSATFQPILKSPKADTEKAVKVLWSSLHGICSLTFKQKLRFAKKQDTLELCQGLFHNYILGYRISAGII